MNRILFKYLDINIWGDECFPINEVYNEDIFNKILMLNLEIYLR
jgi:hypothetical protein